MHSLSIALRDNPAVWMLMFKTRETAQEAWAKLSEPTAMISDDFGQSVMVDKNHIGGAILEDLDQSQLAHIARALHNARTQAKAQTQAHADPVLRASAMTSGNPAAVISQMNGGFRG